MISRSIYDLNNCYLVGAFIKAFKLGQVQTDFRVNLTIQIDAGL